MLETLDRMVLAGLGALSMTRQKAERLYDEMVSQGRAQREQRAKFVEDLMDSASRTRHELEAMIAQQVRSATERLNLASREDLLRLEAKIDQLLNRKSANASFEVSP